MVEPGFALAEWELVIAIECEAVPDVVYRVRKLIDEGNQSHVPVPDCRRQTSRVAGVVQSMRPSVGGQERQTARIAFFYFCLERVIGANASEMNGAYSAEVGKRLILRGADRGIEESAHSIRIVIQRKVPRDVANVADGGCHIIRQ